MSATPKLQLSQFAYDVVEGLSRPRQKQLPPAYFYDALGSTLFEAITLLSEYGLTRADERILRDCAGELASLTGSPMLVAELGSGSGRKTAHILRSLNAKSGNLVYRPIDVSGTALHACERELAAEAEVLPVCADWLDGLRKVSRERDARAPMLLLFLGSSIGNLDRAAITRFLEQIHSHLHPGDFFLLGADLIKDVDVMISAYDDPLGVTAAFNLNLLARMNRELGADFDLRGFAHEVRWNETERRIEMHLLSCRNQDVFFSALSEIFSFTAGETIWTESSHKFTERELNGYAQSLDFKVMKTWIDSEWPFAETLWQVV